MGPQGLQGPTGATGATGAPGPSEVIFRSTAKHSALTNDSVSVACLDGEIALSGGGYINIGDISGVLYFETGGRPTLNGSTSIPGAESPNGWRISWYNQSNNDNEFVAYVICAEGSAI